MNVEDPNLHSLMNGHQQLYECRLCGKSSETCLDLATLSDVIPLGYIHKNIGIKLKSNDILPNFICKLCTQQITDWQKFVRSCTEAQTLARY